MKWFLGIDIAEDKFDAALVDDNGIVCRRKTGSNTSKGQTEFVAWLRSVKIGDQSVSDPHVGMEATNTYKTVSTGVLELACLSWEQPNGWNDCRAATSRR